MEPRLTVGDEDSAIGGSRNGRIPSLRLVEGAAERAFGDRGGAVRGPRGRRRQSREAPPRARTDCLPSLSEDSCLVA